MERDQNTGKVKLVFLKHYFKEPIKSDNLMISLMFSTIISSIMHKKNLNLHVLVTALTQKSRT